MTNIGQGSQPLEIFAEWLAEAKQHPHIKEATAMSLATAGPDALHARVVLCKQWSEQGFVFFTNYQSQKGLDLQHNSNAAAVFYWDPLFRQISITGRVSKTSRQVSEAYWNQRPRDSQLSQYISRQSQVAESREVLEAAWTQADKEFSGKVIPCPPHWGGYQIEPKQIEFWIGKPGRFHDRHQFERQADSWTYHRLYP